MKTKRKQFASNAVFKKRCLWDQQHKLYHNRHIVDQNWNDISKELNVDAMSLKKKWKQLRDTFRVELRKFPPERSGDAGPESLNEMCSQWTHFESMKFIKDQIKCRQSSGNLSRPQSYENVSINAFEDSTIGDTELSVDIEAPHSANKETPQYDEESNISTFEVDTSTPQHHAPKKLKRRHDNIEGEILEIEKKKLELLDQKNKSRIPADDEDMAFFVSLLPHVRKMDPQTKLLCRMDMQRSVYNYAYNVGRSFQATSISVPSPTVFESSSTAFSDNALSPQDPMQYVSSGNVVTFSNL
ncbi:uncharacterized protein LOC133838776 [Drosophila sulfurigaster albostrigata]|uniref:uncharacterized protein LOC133838776 n=1 Tax=Drosophila sulfurigaster albostrigata TaxID=89887 RepID=UPI002D21A2ED|nr:uncharacterized protein LOC133838776 [Drosophila sulfurigaster albostrigata]